MLEDHLPELLLDKALKAVPESSYESNWLLEMPKGFRFVWRLPGTPANQRMLLDLQQPLEDPRRDAYKPVEWGWNLRHALV
jgi:hypothetical protein